MIATNVPSGSLRKLDEHRLESQKAFQHQQLVIQMFDEDLKSIFDLRDDYAKGMLEQVAFESLELLFSLRNLLREPDRGHPPALVRVSYVTGDRRMLNHESFKSSHLDQRLNPGENSECIENRFSIHIYSLSFDGESYGRIDTYLSIPGWERMMNVRWLECFPVQYYESYLLGREQS